LIRRPRLDGVILSLKLYVVHVRLWITSLTGMRSGSSLTTVYAVSHNCQRDNSVYRSSEWKPPRLDSECYGSGLARGVRISVHFSWQNLAQNDVEEKLDEIPCKIDQQGKSNHNIEKVASIPLEQGDFCFRRIV